LGRLSGVGRTLFIVIAGLDFIVIAGLDPAIQLPRMPTLF
jgi:hypothetical protein